MKVLYFTRDYTPHDFRFLKAITDIGCDCYFLRLENKLGYESRPLPAKVRVIDTPLVQGSSWLDEEAAVVNRLQQVVETLHPDVVHSGPLDDISFLCAKAQIHPFVAMSWGFDLQHDIVDSTEKKERAAFALKACDWFLGDCYVELDIATDLGLCREKSTIFPWGIDIDYFSHAASSVRTQLAHPDEFLILSLRTMEPNYDVETALRGFLLAARENPKIKIVMLGDGGQRRKLMELANESTEGQRVLWLGRCKNDLLPDYYRASDLYLSASIVDGSSVSLLEAMGCQTPVLVSDIAGNREWVTDAANGMLFEVGNKEEVAQKILWGVEHKRVLDQYAKTARQLIEEKADWNKNKQLLLTAYHGAMK